MSEPYDAPQVSPTTKTRVWPLAVTALIQVCLVIFWLTPSLSNLARFLVMMAGPAVCSALFSVLLAFAVRLGFTRGASIVLANIAMGAAVGATAAARSGIGAWFMGVPLAIVICTVAIAVSRNASVWKQVAVAVSCTAAGWLLIGASRIDGIDGSYMPEMSFRWTATPEDRLLAELNDDPPTTLSEDVTATKWTASENGWTGFRGPNRDSRVTEDIPEQDWNDAPPAEVWRRPVGPGWSSMAVVSGRLFTQEQRGEDEAITCYDALTGEPIWVHRERARFEDVVSGAGPRATPTVVGGTVFAFGAKGIIVALDADDGRLLWRRNLQQDFSSTIPVWGFSASPLVIDNMVFVYGGGTGGFAALHVENGETMLRSVSPGMNFVSAQLMNFDGMPQVVLVEPGTIRAIDPFPDSHTGDSELWRVDIIDEGGFPMVQPQQIGENTLVVATGDGKETACLQITNDGGWSTNVLWKSRFLKPSFNDFLLYEDALYGFDKEIFACIDADTGERRWKNGRYGFGQAILLATPGQIVVAAESGELVLLDATPDGLAERGRVPAMNAKTWNHPAVDAGLLYVRNAEEMVCYRLR